MKKASNIFFNLTILYMAVWAIIMGLTLFNGLNIVNVEWFVGRETFLLYPVVLFLFLALNFKLKEKEEEKKNAKNL